MAFILPGYTFAAAESITAFKLNKLVRDATLDPAFVFPPGTINIGSLSMNADRILGRTTPGLGPAEEISVGAGLLLAAGVLSAVVVPPPVSVGSITGTANQVFANGTFGVPQTGPVTLTLPQDIGLTSNVQFGAVTSKIAAATHPVGLGNNSDFPAFGALSFNSSYTNTGIIGLVAGGDTNLYLKTVAGGNIYPVINGVIGGYFSSTGLNNTRIGVDAPQDGHFTNVTASTLQAEYTSYKNAINTVGFDVGLLGGDAVGFVFNRANAPIIFGTNNAERVRIDAAGNVGIGTPAPTQKLQLGSGSEVAMRISGPGVNWDLHAESTGDFTIENGNGAYARFLRDTSVVSFPLGNVGIGTTAPTEKLQVNGNVRIEQGQSLWFPHVGAGDNNSGRLGVALFSSGLNITGSNTDGTYRKYSLWGQITQHENGGTNSWVGKNQFTGGNVSIGGVPNSSRLFITGGDQSETRITIQNTGGGTYGLVAGFDSVSQTGFSIHEAGVGTVFRLAPGGNVGIGLGNSEPSATYKLDVVGNTRLRGHPAGGWVENTNEGGASYNTINSIKSDGSGNLLLVLRTDNLLLVTAGGGQHSFQANTHSFGSTADTYITRTGPGALAINGSLQTGVPSGAASAPPWKLGDVAAGVARVEIGGVGYNLITSAVGGDTNLFLAAPVSLVNSVEVSGLNGVWSTVDLTAQIAAAGLAGRTIKAAHVMVSSQLNPAAALPSAYIAYLEILCWGNNGGSGLRAFAIGASSTVGGVQTNDGVSGDCGIFDGHTLYWHVAFSGSAAARLATITLLGFVYQ